MTQLSNDTERPDFELYKVGLREVKKLPSPHLATICCTLIAGLAISKWSMLPPTLGVTFAGMLMSMVLIHSVMVHRDHAKNRNKTEDDTT